MTLQHPWYRRPTSSRFSVVTAIADGRSDGALTRTIPLVDYLVIEGERPYLRVHECTECRARYFDRRNGCANCGGSAFVDARVSDTGTVRAFTIVSFAAPGVPVPVAPAIVDCDGTTVRANIVNIPLDP